MPEGIYHTYNTRLMSLNIYLPQHGVGIHGVLSWAPWGCGCMQGHVRPYGVYPGACIDKAFLKCSVNIKLGTCIYCTFIMFKKFVTFQECFGNITKTLFGKRLTRLIHDRVI